MAKSRFPEPIAPIPIKPIVMRSFAPFIRPVKREVVSAAPALANASLNREPRVAQPKIKEIASNDSYSVWTQVAWGDLASTLCPDAGVSSFAIESRDGRLSIQRNGNRPAGHYRTSRRLDGRRQDRP